MHANQPNFYAAQYQTYSQTASPFTEYSQELSYLSAPTIPSSHSTYWQSARDESVRLLSHGPPTSQSNYALPTQWNRNSASSSFQAPALANSLLQRLNPSAAYPTPPPPGIQASSSSLAFALGNPNKRPNERVYKPEESGPFFKDFLNRSAQLLESKSIPSAPSVARKDTAKVESVPRPSNSSLISVDETVSTPRKRKSPEGLSTPSLKRVQTSVPQHTTPASRAISTTPSQTSSKTTPRQVMAYVHVPPASWKTPSKKRSRDEVAVSDESEEEESRYAQRDVLASVKSSARRTGDRDERAPLEKLITLIEDIFEAEDSLSPDAQAVDLPKEFFSPLTSDCNYPQLQHNLIRKLTKYISQLAHPPKRARRLAREVGSSSTSGVKARESLGDIESPILSRLMKILERSIKAGEDLDPFRTSMVRPSASSSPTKSHKQSTAEEGANMVRGPSPPESQHQQLSDSDVRTLAIQLEIARDSILAAECCIALLSGEGLTKQLYSEELITTCLSTIKNQLTMVVYPFIEGTTIGTSASPQLQCIHRYTHSGCADLRRLMSELFQALSAGLPRVNSLFSADGIMMSDTIIIQAVYIAIGPFFVVESHEGDLKGKKENAVLSTLGSSAMRGLRLDALSIIRSIFANHEDQRSWIIEEILSSLIKLSNSHKKAGQFRLRDGRSIRTVSALLLQLVQTSARDVRVAARKIAKARQNHSLRRQDSSLEKLQDTMFDEHDAKEVQLYISGLEPATTAAKTIILFLTQRSGKGKQTKNSNEAEYRIIFDNLISDLLVVLYWPEWPAASLILSVICKFMVTSLDDVKTSQQADTNAAKTIALDHLGVIAGRLRASAMRARHRGGKDPIIPLDEIVSSESIKDFEKLLAHHEAISGHLWKRSSDDQAYESARELTAAMWGHELAVTLRPLQNTKEADGSTQKPSTMVFCTRLHDALSGVWQDHPSDVFNAGSQEEIARVDLLAEDVGTVQSLTGSFGPILNVILMALDAPPVFMRTKALRALGQIVTSDSSVLSMVNVRRAIESHLLDSSPAVRDAAVELIGKYMIESPEVVGDYYSKIADRIADTGLGVRKRVIKLLKQYYGVIEDLSRRIDICTKLVLRMLDEDDTVKDLAVKTIEELWFSNSLGQAAPNSKSRLSSQPQNKAPLLDKVSVIMGVSVFFKDRQSPLEDLLHKIISNQNANDLPLMRARYSEICEALIDGLVDATDLPGFTVQSCVRTLYLFATAFPSVLSGSNASTLLPYLKNPASSDELVVSDYLLRVFRISIPHMPRTAVKFGQDLQLVLQPMIVKPSNVGGIVCLQESVACMCGVVQHLTHDFHRLVALLKSCNARLQQAISRKVESMNPVETRMLCVLIFIVALLGEHCDFDKLRVERAEFAPELNSVAEGPLVEHIYNTLLALYAKYTDVGLKGRILQCLGFLFRAQPTLMTLEQSAGIMDAIFASPDEESRGRLLRILQDFLVSEAAKHTEQQKGSGQVKKEGGLDMAQLVGNTDDFADSGVSSAVVQRYLTHILDAALSRNPQVQVVAVEILSFTVKQGLAHPLQSFPVIVALETSPVPATSGRASALHAILYSKHMSLLNSRFIVSARQSFDYQKTISPNNVQGYRINPEPTALLHRWYSLVREKRTPRQDFLKALVKSFDISPSLKSTQNDIDFVRYMAENFATLDYKTLEEILTVIKHLTSILSTSGMQLIDLVSPSHLLAQLHEPQSQPLTNGTTISTPPAMVNLDVDVMRTSVIIGMVMLLKMYLKALYGLTEEKCSKYVPGKKSAIGDKPATKRNQQPISWERLPFATRPLLLPEDLVAHRTTFLQVWNADGAAPEPEDTLE